MRLPRLRTCALRVVCLYMAVLLFICYFVQELERVAQDAANGIWLQNASRFLATAWSQQPIEFPGNLSSTGWLKITPILFIYSAFLDARKPLMVNIRMIIVLKQKVKRPALLCHFPHNNTSTATVYYEMCENHGRSFGSYILSCPVPTGTDNGNLKSVQLVLENSLNSNGTNTSTRVLIQHHIGPESPTEGRPPSARFTVCVHSPLYGNFYSNRYLVEFVELSKLLGADRFVFYLTDSTFGPTNRLLLKTLRYYEKQRTAVLLNWRQIDPAVNKDGIWYNGQSAALQDCLYRSMGASHFTLLNDIDEYLIPSSNFSNWHMLADYLWTNKQNATGFGAIPAYFLVDKRPPQTVDGYALRFFTSYGPRDSLSGRLSKCVVKPKRVFEMGIHHISKQNEEWFANEKLEPVLGRLHHYTSKFSGRVRNDGYMNNTVILDRYGTELNSLTAHVLRQLELIKP